MKIYLDGEIPTMHVSYSSGLSPENSFRALGFTEISKMLFDAWDKDTIEMREEFKVVFLNNSNVVKGIYTISVGGLSSTVVDMQMILGIALITRSSGCLIAHNHPSGNLQPSPADIAISKKFELLCKFHGILLLDHIIVTPSGKCTSLYAEGHIGKEDDTDDEFPF